ncbi:MAG: hypothetical protein WCF90_03470, partial [Methanomicrobiales archaeon]
ILMTRIAREKTLPFEPLKKDLKRPFCRKFLVAFRRIGTHTYHLRSQSGKCFKGCIELHCFERGAGRVVAEVKIENNPFVPELLKTSHLILCLR